jgi:hypothetical protein
MWVVPKGHVLFGAIEPIPPKPKLSTPRLDDEAQTATVGKFIHFLSRFRVLDFFDRGGSGKLNTGEGGGSRLIWPKMA